VPKCYGAKLFPCFFLEWLNVNGVVMASLMLFAANPDENVSARARTFTAPAEAVFFVDSELAKSQGLEPTQHKDGHFAPYAVSGVISQPSDLPAQPDATVDRVIVKSSHYASLPVLTLCMIPRLGEGIDIRVSRIPDGGRGLYAMRSFLENELITLYSGHRFGEQQRKGMQELGLGTHCKPLEQKLAYLDGVKTAFEGMHVAQFANHGGSRANASFITIEEIPFTGDKVIAIKASRYIFPGEEIYLNYGVKFWSEQNIDPEGAPPVVLPSSSESISQKRKACN
jgi:hypothetical protein